MHVHRHASNSAVLCRLETMYRKLLFKHSGKSVFNPQFTLFNVLFQQKSMHYEIAVFALLFKTIAALPCHEHSGWVRFPNSL